MKSGHGIGLQWHGTHPHPLFSLSGTTHSFSEEEKLAFVDWINYQLEEDADLKNHLPVAEEGSALFEAVHDGLILW